MTAEKEAEPAAALAEAMRRQGYAGDVLTYDDLQNANLIRVIDRRKGLPVALGILWIHAARARGWRADGLAFPGHFLVRLEHRVIVDPFNEGRLCDAAFLRRLLRATAGAAEPRARALRRGKRPDDPSAPPEQHQAAGLEGFARKGARGAGANAPPGARRGRAPPRGRPRRSRDGKLRTAAAHFGRACIDGDDLVRHRAAALLQQLRSRLH